MFTQGAAQCQCTSFEPLCESCDCGCLVIARSDDSAPDPGQILCLDLCGTRGDERKQAFSFLLWCS